MSPPRHSDPTGYYRDGRYISGLGFSRDGKILAAASDDGELQIWEMATWNLLNSMQIGLGEASNPVFSPDGKLVAAGPYADGTVSLVEVSSGRVLSQIQVPCSDVGRWRSARMVNFFLRRLMEACLTMASRKKVERCEFSEWHSDQ